MTTRQILDQLVRRQRSKLTAQLVSRCGYQLLPLIEDAIQDALLKALERWEYDGLPDQAEAWLYRVAYHRAIDLLRKTSPELPYDEDADERLDAAQAEDAELRLLLLCCHRDLTTIEQQLLMLNLVIGMDYAEIATLTLSSKDAIAQRLARIKRKSRTASKRDQNIDWDETTLASVTTTIYAAFSVGYFPRRGEQLIRREVALEALRLSTVFAHQCPPGSGFQGQLFALAALMSFQSSRLDARQNERGEPILLADQDPSSWDRKLIEQGQQLLKLAQRPNEFSVFHLEAGIAALHTKGADQTDWPTVVELYNALLKQSPSPGRIIGAAVARCRIADYQGALELLIELEAQRDLTGYSPFYLAKSRALEGLGLTDEAATALTSATHASSSAPILRFMEEQVF